MDSVQLVGGPRDGEMIAIKADQDIVKFMVAPRFSINMRDTDDPPRDLKIRQIVYRRRGETGFFDYQG